MKCRNQHGNKPYLDPIGTQYLAQESISVSNRIPVEYNHLGQCTCVCRHCGAMFWECEKVASASNTSQFAYNKCCYGGRVILRPPPEYPQYIKELYENAHFMENIRAYNQMFAMTSLGANVDKSINNGKGPYVFRISGQLYHWIGSLCPEEGQSPRFLQLYIYDTTNEVKNRLAHFSDEHQSDLKEEIVEGLIEFLDKHNALVQLFRTARNKHSEADIPEFKIRLYNVIGTRQYELPTSETIGAIVFANSSTVENEFDLIIEEHSRFPQRVSKLHPCYMSLQFPLLFVYGEDGYQRDMKLANIDQLLFSQSSVASSSSTIVGDRDGSHLGLRTVLTASFTGSPRYMYAHYLDALAICRVHGSPAFFITFTCNTKWPEIEEFMAAFPQLTVADRADIIDRVFEKKVRDYIDFVRDSNTFGAVVGVLYTIEFQKRGLPHCHSLLWINGDSKVQQDIDVDKYVCAELPDPVTDPNTYVVISELMIHGPCGSANPTATCMKDGGSCNRNFPKPYCNKTYIDKEGFVHYRRRDTEIQVQRQHVWLDNRYVVPYNTTLCLRYYAHINVEYCGWTMLIKYLFKYISKGTDRVIANIARPSASDSSTSDVPVIQIDEIKNYVEARYIGPHEACWRILDFPIHYRNPPVQTLAVHLENMQQLKQYADGRHLTYLNFPSEYAWHATDRYWQRRRYLSKPSIGRLIYIHPSAAACQALGLLSNDEEWVTALQEASVFATASELRRLFVYILIFCNVSDPLQLWNKDEAPMNDRRCFEALDRSLKDICDRPNTLFGGKSIMLGDDFRQTLPVKKKASKPEIIDASITSSYLWPTFKVYTLMENMRLHQPETTEAERMHIQNFSTWLLNIGNGTIGEPDETDTENAFAIHIPPELCIPDSETALAALIEFIYDQKTLQTPTPKDLQKKAIVCITPRIL
ncbi:DNA helicase, partial [Tanacetum coccineum]